MKRKNTASVYIIENTELNRVKIGYASNVSTRFSCIRSQSGCEMVLRYHTKPIYNYKFVESSMHTLFKDSRGIGEWFNITPGEAMKKLKGLENEFNTCKIVEMYLEGNNPTEIGDAVGLSRSGVVKYLLQTEVYHEKENKKQWEKKLNRKSNTNKSVKSLIPKDAIEAMVKRNQEKVKAKRNNRT